MEASTFYLLCFVIFLVVPGIIVGLLFAALSAKNSKWYWNSVWFVLLTGYVWFIGSLLGSLEAFYQLEILQHERYFFWNLFENALAKHPDFQTAVASMLTSEIHTEVIQYIDLTLLKYTILGTILSMRARIEYAIYRWAM